jgi:hypothetical protein
VQPSGTPARGHQATNCCGQRSLRAGWCLGAPLSMAGHWSLPIHGCCAGLAAFEPSRFLVETDAIHGGSRHGVEVDVADRHGIRSARADTADTPDDFTF